MSQTGVWRSVAGKLRRAWKFMRALSGDDAYERYLEHMRLHGHNEKVMTRREYYRFLVEQRGKQNRCC